MAVSNPRWPHTCKIYYRDEPTNFSSGKEIVVYEGECRKYDNSSIRTFNGKDNVVRADYALSIPGQVGGITAGMFVDVVDLVGLTKGAFITDSYPTNLGTTVYFNLSKN
jgi:hypothetical protein|nr:MAG TPA: hypothetical protein [Caudoviricetes sp.]